jgi:GAF domain-containing protein
MPKKKPVDKRLNNLFKDINSEQAPADPNLASAKPAVPAASSQPHVEDTSATQPMKPIRRANSLPAQNPSVLSLAFQTGQNSWATLQVMDEGIERKWTQDEQLLVKQVADQLSLALENAQLFQETQSRAEELVVLNELGKELATKLDTRGIAETLYKYTSRMMDTRFFFVAMHDEKTSIKTYPVAFEKAIPISIPGTKVTGSGFTDFIIRNKRPVFAPDNVPAHMQALGIEFVPLDEDDTPSLCWLGVPMLIGDRVLGVISVQSTEKANLYDEHDRDVLTAIASQAAIAVENARLFAESQSRARETEALAEVGREISATLDLTQVLGRIASYAKDLLFAESCAVYLPDETGDQWNAISALGLDAEEIKSDPILKGRGILGGIVTTGEGQIINNASATDEAVTISGTAVGRFEHLMGVPVLVGDKITGLMAVWRTGEGLEFVQSELDFLKGLAQQAAVALENARLFKNVSDSQVQLSEALRIARIGYFEIDLDSRNIALTDELFSLLNTSAEKEGGYIFPFQVFLEKFILEDDRSIVAQTLLHAVSASDERRNQATEVRYKTSDGR